MSTSWQVPWIPTRSLAIIWTIPSKWYNKGEALLMPFYIWHGPHLASSLRYLMPSFIYFYIYALLFVVFLMWLLFLLYNNICWIKLFSNYGHVSSTFNAQLISSNPLIHIFIYLFIFTYKNSIFYLLFLHISLDTYC